MPAGLDGCTTITVQYQDGNTDWIVVRGRPDEVMAKLRGEEPVPGETVVLRDQDDREIRVGLDWVKEVLPSNGTEGCCYLAYKNKHLRHGYGVTVRGDYRELQAKFSKKPQ